MYRFNKNMSFKRKGNIDYQSVEGNDMVIVREDNGEWSEPIWETLYGFVYKGVVHKWVDNWKEIQVDENGEEKEISEDIETKKEQVIYTMIKVNKADMEEDIFEEFQNKLGYDSWVERENFTLWVSEIKKYEGILSDDAIEFYTTLIKTQTRDISALYFVV